MSGRTHIYQECKNDSCRSKTDRDALVKAGGSLNFYGDPCHDIHKDENNRHYSVCNICGHVDGFRDPDDIAKTSYPYTNASIDVTFTDKHQERQYVKKHGLVAKDWRAKDRVSRPGRSKIR